MIHAAANRDAIARVWNFREARKALACLDVNHPLRPQVESWVAVEQENPVVFDVRCVICGGTALAWEVPISDAAKWSDWPRGVCEECAA